MSKEKQPTVLEQLDKALSMLRQTAADLVKDLKKLKKTAEHLENQQILDKINKDMHQEIQDIDITKYRDKTLN